MVLEAKKDVAQKVPITSSRKATVLKLPVQILSLGDVSRLNREVEEIESFFMDAALRGGTNLKDVPQLSLLLATLISENDLNVLHKEDRVKVGEFLKLVLKKAPVIHASFATDPRPEFLMKLMDWFRKEAHPYALFKVGLQPTIAAGCVFRTTNKYFDFSFKHHFADSKAKLGTALKAIK